MNNEIIERVAKVRDTRDLLASSRSALKAKQDAFAADNADLIDSVQRLTVAVTASETALKAVVEAEYRATGEKKPAAGVEVKLFKEFTVDEVAGLAWAKEKDLCLVPEKLDLNAVKKLATVQKLPFVEVSEIPKVTIATDLAKALASVESQDNSPASPAEV